MHLLFLYTEKNHRIFFKMVNVTLRKMLSWHARRQICPKSRLVHFPWDIFFILQFLERSGEIINHGGLIRGALWKPSNIMDNIVPRGLRGVLSYRHNGGTHYAEAPTSWRKFLPLKKIFYQRRLGVKHAIDTLAN